MIQAPKQCPLCHQKGREEIWNNLPVFVCPECTLAWRTVFDLPGDHYAVISVDDEEGKQVLRQQNCLDQVASLKKFLPPTNICDLGSGDGSFLAVLKERGYKDCIGVEPGKRGLQLSQRRGLQVVPGVIADLPHIAAQHSIQVITLFHLLEHLDDPQTSLDIIKQVLPPTGVLIIETPDANAPLQRLTNHQNHLVYPEHLFYWNEKSLKKLLLQGGFNVVAIKHRSFNWRRMPIKQSLLRLGLSSRIAPQSEKFSNKQLAFSPKNKLDRDNYLRFWARFLLAWLVHLLRRDDYIVVVARPKWR